MSAELLTAQGKYVFSLTPEGQEPLWLVAEGSALWPEGAPEPEFGVLFAHTSAGERHAVIGDPKTVTRLGELIDVAERTGAPRHIRRLIQRKLAAGLTLKSGWPDDWVAEGGAHHGN